MNPSSRLRGQMSGCLHPMAADRKTASTPASSLPLSEPSSFGLRRHNRPKWKGFRDPMRKTYSAFAAALTLGVLTYATSAGAIIRPSITDTVICPGTLTAQHCLTPAVANPAWGDAPGEEEVILDTPIFVTGGATLTILPGVTVRGNPRSAGVLAGQTGGTPGVLIATRSGKFDWQGDATSSGVIVMTTAAVDNNNDKQPDDFDGNGFEDPYPGYDPALSGAIPGTLPCTCANNGTPAIPGDDCVGTDLILGTGDDVLGNCVVDATPAFHDDDPRVAPLSPLTPPISPDPGLGPDGLDGTADDVGGFGNVALWGGVVMLGKAPTNTAGASTGAAADAGDDIIEGMTV